MRAARFARVTPPADWGWLSMDVFSLAAIAKIVATGILVYDRVKGLWQKHAKRERTGTKKDRAS